jgi:arabinofuranan 3-O-arabinosyltransferase
VGVPRYWRDAADFLAKQPLSRTLLTPSSSFADYTWGRPLDEPLQSFGRSPWVSSSIFPGGGTLQATRLLNQIDTLLSRGEGVPGLSAVLARSGIRYVLVRADLDRERTGSTEPIVIGSALELSPGITRLRSFGPPVSSAPTADRLTAKVVAPLHAIEVFEVAGAPSIVGVGPADAVRLMGGLESMLNPDVAAFIGPRPVVVDTDGGDVLPTTVGGVSDALRFRDRVFGDTRGSVNASYTLGAGELPAGSRQLLPRDLTLPTESLSIAGDDAAHVFASSSYGPLTRFPEAQPYAAYDTNPWTAWMPGPAATDGSGEWIQTNFARPQRLEGTTMQLLLDVPWRPTIDEVTAVTDKGSVRTKLFRSADVQTIGVPPGEATFLRLEIVKVAGFPGGSSQVGIADVAIPGFVAGRPLIAPSPPANVTPSFFFARSSAPSLDPSRWSEEPLLDRLFSTTASNGYRVTARASIRQPSSVETLASLFAAAATRAESLRVASDTAVSDKAVSDKGVSATATSSWFGRSTTSAIRAIDGDATTGWVADPFDPTPTLSVSWTRKHTLSGVRIIAMDAPSLTPTDLVVRAAGETPRRVSLVNGVASFEPIETSALDIEVVASQRAFGTAATVTPPAVAIREISFEGSTATFDSSAVVDLPCGSGPTIRIDSTEVRTRPLAPVSEIISGGEFAVELCASVPDTLPSGPHRLTEVGGGPFALSSVALTAINLNVSSTESRSARVDGWADDARRIEVAAGPATVLSIAENFNAGWDARFQGASLPSVRLDGWHQGWVIPAGDAGTVTLTFHPSRTFAIALRVWVLGIGYLALAGWFVARRRQADETLLTERPIQPWVTDIASLVALGAVGGLVVAIVPVLRRLRRDPLVLSALAAGAMVLSTVVSAIGHRALPGSASGAFSGVAQVSSLVALGCVLLA